jgi:cell division protein FtsZ
MTTNSPTESAGASAGTVPLKIFGLGTAGLAVLEQIAQGAAPGAALVAGAADAGPLAASCASEKIALETHLLRGLGTGGDPERGHALAEENLARLKAACAGAKVVFIVAGLGGGVGTGVSPVLARAARESGALVLAFVTLPFDCEGSRRCRQAGEGLEDLKAAADGVVCLPNQKIFKLIDEHTSVLDTFKLTGQLLAEVVGGVWRLAARKGLIEIHLADFCALLRERKGESVFATAEAAGATRSREAVDKLLAHPMLDNGRALAESEAVLVSLVGGPDLTMTEVNRVMEHINGKCARAQVMMGAAIDEGFGERLAITVIAARHGKAGRAAASEAAHPAERLDAQLLNPAAGPRPHSRFVAPPPTLTPDKLEQLVAKQTGAGRSRKVVSKMRQGQLPLEIVTRGRFDKSEPTIHKGEDLDMPTYVRRGIVLN